MVVEIVSRNLRFGSSSCQSRRAAPGTTQSVGRIESVSVSRDGAMKATTCPKRTVSDGYAS